MKSEETRKHDTGVFGFGQTNRKGKTVKYKCIPLSSTNRPMTIEYVIIKASMQWSRMRATVPGHLAYMFLTYRTDDLHFFTY